MESFSVKCALWTYWMRPIVHCSMLTAVMAPLRMPEPRTLQPTGGTMSDHYTALAQRLRDAYAKGPVPPLRDGLEPTDSEGAYAVQAANTAFWSASGRRIAGRKVGLTAKAVQAQLGVDQPDFGVLFADMQIADGGDLFASKVLQPKAEAEIAFVLKADLPGIRTSPGKRSPRPWDLSSRRSRSSIAGSRTGGSPLPTPWRTTDRRRSTCWAEDFKPHGRSRSYGVAAWCWRSMGRSHRWARGAACLGHPLNAATWLARTLAARGEPLRAGDVC
jgi:2-keto-4-pentenoate hydratase